MNRRDALAIGLGAAATALPAWARVPLATAQVIPVYRQRLGEFVVTAVCDGHLEIDPKLFPTAVEAEANALLDRAFLPRGPILTVVNAYVVNGPRGTVLIDAGTGRGYTPTLGELPANLRAAGIEPSAVDAVLLTHVHPDHAWGLIDEAGARVFPNAEIVLSRAEHAFWFDDAVLAGVPEEVKPFFAGARRALGAYAGRVRLFERDGEVVPGIAAIAAPGHTPGHTAFRVGTGADALVIWGDVVHAQPLQFARPDWSIIYDVDGAAAAATRRRLFDMAAADRLLVGGMHLPFPGLGHVAREGDSYAYVPQAFRPTL